MIQKRPQSLSRLGNGRLAAVVVVAVGRLFLSLEAILATGACLATGKGNLPGTIILLDACVSSANGVLRERRQLGAWGRGSMAGRNAYRIFRPIVALQAWIAIRYEGDTLRRLGAHLANTDERALASPLGQASCARRCAALQTFIAVCDGLQGLPVLGAHPADAESCGCGNTYSVERLET